jgi:hypothetical protein
MRRLLLSRPRNWMMMAKLQDIAMTPEEREVIVAELRERYLAGTLGEVLVPTDTTMDRVLVDLLPRRTARRIPRMS